MLVVDRFIWLPRAKHARQKLQEQRDLENKYWGLLDAMEMQR